VATAEAPVQGDIIGAVRAAEMQTSAFVLIGYSAGCQAVRSHLRGGIKPVAVVTIDGTHASLPPLAWQVDVWSNLAEQARKGKVLWVATCLAAHRYVERLPQGRYSATSTVLAAALGLPLLATAKPSPAPLPSYPGPTVFEVSEGDLHLLAYGSQDTDKAAHAAQQQVVLPHVLREYVAPWIAASAEEDTPVTDRTPPPMPTPVRFALDAGLAVLAVAQQDLDASIRESWAHNDGPEIRALYLEPLKLAPGSNYCAAAVASWIRRAEKLYGVKVPITGGPGAKATLAELIRSGLWTPVAKMNHDDVRPGCLLVWDRSVPGKPDTNWQGHIGICVDRNGGSAYTIEANADRGRETNAVAMVERQLNDPRLLGVGSLRGPTPPAAPHIDVA
jgi:hypothetical protein